MGTSMVEVLAFQINSGTTQMLGKPFGKIEWTGPTDIVFEVVIDLSLKAWICLALLIAFFQSQQSWHQHRDEIKAKETEGREEHVHCGGHP